MTDPSARHLAQTPYSDHAPRLIYAPAKRSQEPYCKGHTDPSTLPAEEMIESNFQSGPTGMRHHSDDLLSTGGANNLQDYQDIVLCSNIDDTDDEQLEPVLSSENPTERATRVRFRSRVRITSGLKRHRHQSQSEQDYLSFSPSSSMSGSPSSSISAPLRSQAEDEVGKPGWGTLGQRVSLLAQGNSQRRKNREQRERSLLAKNIQRGTLTPPDASCGNDVNERTPLTHSSLPVLYLNQELVPDHDILDSTHEEDSNLAREIDLVFGPWPTRLWNHHWWWWQLEPIVCCRCLSESDDEGS